ncbi:MAG: class I SAM-dependent methyltransferase [Flavobacteriales bacterium]|nr:class I SAM-dependent methyltransferase [Flavobacteriales bacterium]
MIDHSRYNGFVEQKRQYDIKYSRGYMEGWPKWKKRRVSNLIKKLNLKSGERFLDFGCGKGEFTAVIKQELKTVKVEGTDISDEALKIAKNAHSDCFFFEFSEENFNHEKYDLVFTHHVLEHVEDIDYTIGQIAKLCREGGKAVNILPCGDRGSLEYLICGWRIDGFDSARGNKMFFEYPGHLRRLTSKELIYKFSVRNFKVEKVFFANVLFGSIEWITSSDLKLIKKITELKNLKKSVYAIPLSLFRVFFLSIYFIRVPAIKIGGYFKKINRRKKYRLLFLLALLFYVPSLIVNTLIIGLSSFEYLIMKQWSGSEMYLIFVKSDKN